MVIKACYRVVMNRAFKNGNGEIYEKQLVEPASL
jgi:hypothetical protein